MLVLLTWIPLLWQQAWGQAPGVGVKATHEKPKNGKGTTGTAEPRGTNEYPFVVDTQGHKQTDIERDEANKQAAKAEVDEQYHRDVDRGTIKWSAITAIATAALILVGIGGIAAAIRTLRAIEDQGKQMAAQVALMRVPYKQWIKVSDWVSGPTHSGDWFFIKVNISNPTAYPVWINKGSISVIRDDGITSRLLGKPVYVMPDTSHLFDVHMEFSEDELGMFETSGLMLELRGDFTHTGVLGEDSAETYPIVGTLMCQPGRTEFFPLAHRMIPKPANDGQNQSAN
jgi:hypothetical protein